MDNPFNANEITYDILVTGNIKDGYTREQVESTVAQLFQIEPDAVSDLLSGRGRTVKRCQSRQKAERLFEALDKAGVVVQMRLSDLQGVPSGIAKAGGGDGVDEMGHVTDIKKQREILSYNLSHGHITKEQYMEMTAVLRKKKTDVFWKLAGDYGLHEPGTKVQEQARNAQLEVQEKASKDQEEWEQKQKKRALKRAGAPINWKAVSIVSLFVLNVLIWSFGDYENFSLFGAVDADSADTDSAVQLKQLEMLDKNDPVAMEMRWMKQTQSAIQSGRFFVEYQVNGSSASLTYSNEEGGTEQHDVYLPWRKAFVVDRGTHLYLSAQNKSDYDPSVSVSISINGTVQKQSTSTARYGIASASVLAR